MIQKHDFTIDENIVRFTAGSYVLNILKEYTYAITIEMHISRLNVSLSMKEHDVRYHQISDKMLLTRISESLITKNLIIIRLKLNMKISSISSFFLLFVRYSH